MKKQMIKLGEVEIYPPRQLVLDALQYISSGSALELGCGFGRHSLVLATKGFDVTAVEPNAEMIESLQKKTKTLGVSIHTETIDLKNFDPKGEEYDLVLSTMVLHFLPNHEEVVQAIHNMQRFTKAGGINVVCAYTDKSQPDLRPYLINSPELQNLYKDWELLQFKEYQGTDAAINGPDKGKKIWRVEMIARKI